MATSLELAITAIRSGRKEEGRQLLNLMIQQNPNDEMAWLWMTSVVNTDEQRARCLYHVLAINPTSTIARRGLEVLGIVLSDSRPVKIPRDSQPIAVQPTGAPFPEPPHALPPQPAEERRPFRIDPRTITQELPFTPIKAPFGGTEAPAENGRDSRPVAPDAPGQKLTQADSTELDLTPLVHLPKVTLPAPVPAEPVPVSPPVVAAGTPNQPAGQPAPDSGPVLPQVSYNQPGPELAATQKMGEPAPAVVPPSNPVAPVPPPSQPFSPAYPGSVMETRPTPAVPLNYGQMGMPLPPQPGQVPPEAMAPHAYPTMGMPAQYLQPQNSWPAPSQIHSNATMGMPAYAHPQYQQQPLMPNVAFYSNATMAMPTMMPADPRARMMTDYGLVPQPAGAPQPYRAVKASRTQTGARREEKDEDEEVNLLAVIIFGSLSVTALGGLGMLILLMFNGG